MFKVLKLMYDINPFNIELHRVTEIYIIYFD